MKIRTGFVSNSSSSSFIVITSKKNHQRALDSLDEIGKNVIAYIMDSHEKQFLDNEVVIGEECSTEDWSTIGDVSSRLGLDYNTISEYWESYQKVLKEKPNELITFMVNL